MEEPRSTCLGRYSELAYEPPDHRFPNQPESRMSIGLRVQGLEFGGFEGSSLFFLTGLRGSGFRVRGWTPFGFRASLRRSRLSTLLRTWEFGLGEGPCKQG